MQNGNPGFSPSSGCAISCSEADINLTPKKVRNLNLVAKAALDELASITSADWEKSFYTIVRRIQTDSRMEPVLKIIFLQKVLEVGCQGSESLKTAFRPYQDLLVSIPIDTAAPWMDPKKEDANRARALAADLVARLPNLRQVGETAAQERAAFVAPLGPKYGWIGWLAHNDKGQWECRMSSRNKMKGQLFIARPQSNGKALKWEQVGRIDGDTIFLDASNSLALLEGRPIFIVNDQPPTGADTQVR